MRYRAFMQRYADNAEREASGRGLFGFIFGAVLTVATGGAAAPALMAGAAGGAVGMGTTDQRSLERTVTTLNETFAGARIETLPVRYATSYHELGVRVTLVKVTEGNLAEAIGRSVANPMIFSRFDPVKAKYLDPGTDRVSAVPIQDACELFPPSRLLVVNATGQPAFYQRRSLPCPVLEVDAHDGPVDQRALIGEGPEFDSAVALGATSTRTALQRAGIRVPRPSAPDRAHLATGVPPR